MEGALSLDNHSWWLVSQWHSGGTITSRIYFSCPPYTYPLSQVLCSPFQLIHLYFWDKSSLNHNHMSSLYMLCSFLPSLPTSFSLTLFCLCPFFPWTNIYSKSTSWPFLVCFPTSAQIFSLCLCPSQIWRAPSEGPPPDVVSQPLEWGSHVSGSEY